MNNTVIIVLNFVEEVNGFKKQPEAEKAGQEQQDYKHHYFFAYSLSKAVPNKTIIDETPIGSGFQEFFPESGAGEWHIILRRNYQFDRG